MSNKDEISLKEAAEYVKSGIREVRLYCDFSEDDSEEAARQKRAREVGEATAVLDTMLAASRAGKVVKG